MTETLGMAGTGLRILPHQGWRSLGLAMALGLGFGGWMALADSILFATIIPEGQRVMVATWPLADRLLFFVRGALQDEITFRLIGLTAIVWGLAKLTGGRSRGVCWTAILLTAFVLWPIASLGYLRTLDLSALTIVREFSLHGAAGMLWGWLYWRHGWLAAVTGHMSAHLVLQPLLGVLG